jgi:hypothetical protein
VLASASRGSVVKVAVKSSYNSTLQRYDFDGEGGAAHSICGVGKLIMEGKLKVGQLRKKDENGENKYGVSDDAALDAGRPHQS